MKSALRMKTSQRFALLTLCLLLAQLAAAQAPSTGAAGASAARSALPRMVRFSGTVSDVNGARLNGTIGITFSLYLEQTGGAPLWLETQNVQADVNGRYSVLLGATKSEGLPAELFAAEQAHWVGVQVSGQVEQPRVLLVSAPYALKAGDAETLGGLPPSAFMLAAPLLSGPATSSTVSAAGSVPPPAATDVTTTGGVANYLPLFNGTSTVVDSVLFQSGSGSTAKIGIGNTAPAATLDVTGGATIRGLLNLPAAAVATASAGADSRPFGLVAATYNSSSLTSTNQVFHWQAEPVGNDTSSPSATLNLLFATAPATAAETGLKINNKGQITFATGQTFPGTGDGTITGVTAGTDLTGGGSSGNVTLNLNTSATDLRYSRLGVANTFTGNQTVNGVLSASSTVFGMSGAATDTTGFSVGVGGTAASSGGYGVEGVNSSTSGGAGVWGTSASSAGYGVEGSVSASSGGTGVYGTAPQFGVYGVATGTGSTVGVYGNGADGLQGSGTVHGVYAAAPTYGLYGVATNTSGTDFGVYGSGSSNGVYGIASNFGVYGVATATSGNSVGVYGSGVDGLQGSGSIYGVYAAGTGSSATGAYGTTASASGYGVEGVNTSSNGTGVYGTAEHFGVQGIATGTSNTVGVYGSGVDGLQGSGSLHGIYVAGTAAGAYGVYSYVPAAGVAATYAVYQGASGTGQTWFDHTSTGGAIWADTSYPSDDEDFYIPALLATADANYAGAFNNNSNSSPTIDVYNYGSGGTSDVLHASGSVGSCTLTSGGDASCTGTLKSVVATTSGARRLETYSMQSPENWFEDFGSGALNNGAATIKLDATFTQTVNTGIEYHVFLTPNGDSRGLYVSQKTAMSFEVREQGGGNSSIAFDYRIVAKRVGYEKVRLADVTERFNEQEARSAKMHSARSSSRPSAAPRSIPAMSAPAHPSTGQHIAPLMLVPPVPPSAAPRPQPVTPRPQSQPVRAALQPVVAAQPR